MKAKRAGPSRASSSRTCVRAAVLVGWEPVYQRRITVARARRRSLRRTSARSGADRPRSRRLGRVRRQCGQLSRQRINRLCGALHRQAPGSRPEQRREARNAACVAVGREWPRGCAKTQLRRCSALRRRGSGVRVQRQLAMHGQHARVVVSRPEGATLVLLVADAEPAICRNRSWPRRRRLCRRLRRPWLRRPRRAGVARSELRAWSRRRARKLRRHQLQRRLRRAQLSRLGRRCVG